MAVIIGESEGKSLITFSLIPANVTIELVNGGVGCDISYRSDCNSYHQKEARQ
ncbi:MAG: hypothetical protein ABEI54_04920 [Candidatus Bipolaricaulia bacterium]